MKGEIKYFDEFNLCRLQFIMYPSQKLCVLPTGQIPLEQISFHLGNNNTSERYGICIRYECSRLLNMTQMRSRVKKPTFGIPEYNNLSVEQKKSIVSRFISLFDDD